GLALITSNDPELRRDKARATVRVGKLRRQLNRLGEAEETLRGAAELLERLRADFPQNAAYRDDLANAYNELGEVLRHAGRPLADAEACYRQALDLGPDLDRRELARTHNHLGIICQDTDRLPQAGRHFD